MARTVTAHLDHVHPKMLRVEGETDRKKLAEQERREVGRTIERAIQLMGVTKQWVAGQCGYEDQGPISRWCTAVERPLLDKLFAIRGFKRAYLLALAENTPNAEIETIVKIRTEVA